ncbi:hypothetical protein BH23CHL7_BH23CHL7_01570 [soil metagenome]
MAGRSTTVTESHDTCFRCGKPTPLGVPLCEHDNPGRIKGPSTTQVHGTIVIGLIVGFVLFAIVGSLIRAGGPFEAAVVTTAAEADGRTAVIVNVTNRGEHSARATCRLSQGGLVGSGDDVFFSDPIPAHETRQFTRLLPAANGPSGRPPQVAVLCN